MILQLPREKDPSLRCICCQIKTVDIKKGFPKKAFQERSSRYANYQEVTTEFLYFSITNFLISGLW